MKITDLSKYAKIKIGKKDYPVHAWTQQQIQDFWEFEGHREDDFFGNQFNDQIAKKIQQHTSQTAFIPDQIVDIGCGTGKLLEKLKEIFPKTDLIGIEPSPNITNKSNTCYQKLSDINEIALKPKVLFILTEVIEHISETQFRNYLSNITNAKTEETHLFLSCPNDEDLSKNFLINPHDGSVYHRYQHIQSYDIDRLRSIIEFFSPQEIRFDALNFNVLSASLIKRLRISLSILLRTLLGRKREITHPHLVTYIRL